MAVKNGFPVLESSASKAEEIEYLHKLAQAITPGSYLGSLFSKKMLEWVESQIHDDGCPDLFGWYETADRQRLDEISARARVESSLSVLEERTKKEIDELNRQVSALQETKRQLAAEISGLQDEVRELIELADERAGEIEWRDRKIVELKAKLYDLMVG